CSGGIRAGAVACRAGRIRAGAGRDRVGDDDRPPGWGREAGGHRSGAGRQWLTARLPKAGFSRPMTLTVLPETLTGMSTGTWMTLPETTPGEPAAMPSAWAPSVAEAMPVPAASSPPAIIVTAAAFFRFFTFQALLAMAGAGAAARTEQRRGPEKDAPSGGHSHDGMNLGPEGNRPPGRRRRGSAGHPVPHRPQGGLGAVREVQLHQDVGDVRLHRLLGEHQGAGDLAVGPAVRYQPEHLALPVGERARPALAGAGVLLGEQGAGHLGLEQDVSRVHGADGP